jgi:hypothetical protein
MDRHRCHRSFYSGILELKERVPLGLRWRVFGSSVPSLPLKAPTPLSQLILDAPSGRSKKEKRSDLMRPCLHRHPRV